MEIKDIIDEMNLLLAAMPERPISSGATMALCATLLDQLAATVPLHSCSEEGEYKRLAELAWAPMASVSCPQELLRASAQLIRIVQVALERRGQTA